MPVSPEQLLKYFGGRKLHADLWNSGPRVLAYLVGTRKLRVSHELPAKREDGVKRLLLLKGQGLRVWAMNLEPKHNQAIRDEIGDRLSVLLSREPPAVSARLCKFLRRFDEADHGSVPETTPSLVPDFSSGFTSEFTKVFDTRLVKS
jgi:hypothetical protein